MKKLLLAALLLVGLNTQVFGFETILTSIKGGDLITFNTNISGASVELNGRSVGVVAGNSFEYRLKRDGSDKSFVFKKAGYQDVIIDVTTKFAAIGVLGGNLLIGMGSFGSSTDSWSTSSSRQYSPNQYYVELNPVK